MPGYDGRGPRGFRHPFGRGLGPCGRGRGLRGAALSKEEQRKILEAELREMESEKQSIEERIAELK